MCSPLQVLVLHRWRTSKYLSNSRVMCVTVVWFTKCSQVGGELDSLFWFWLLWGADEIKRSDRCKSLWQPSFDVWTRTEEVPMRFFHLLWVWLNLKTHLTSSAGNFSLLKSLPNYYNCILKGYFNNNFRVGRRYCFMDFRIRYIVTTPTLCERPIQVWDFMGAILKHFY